MRFNSDIFLAYPDITALKEKESIELKFESFFGEAQTFWKDWPWRLVGVRIQAAACQGTMQSPAIVQCALDTGNPNNVEHLVVKRWMVGPVPSTRYLKARSPNLWKSESMKRQSLLELINLSEEHKDTSNTVVFYIEGEFQFNKAAYLKLSAANHIAHNLARSNSSFSILSPSGAPSCSGSSLNLEEY